MEKRFDKTQEPPIHFCEVQPAPECMSDGALWRDYLTALLSKPIIVTEEASHEVQTAA